MEIRFGFVLFEIYLGVLCCVLFLWILCLMINKIRFIWGFVVFMLFNNCVVLFM